MKRKWWFYSLLPILFLGLLVTSCQDDIKKKEAYRKGKLVIATDPSFLNLGTTLVEIFHEAYPEAQVTFKPEVEDLVIADFVNGKVTMAMVSRDLTPEEAKILLNKTKIKYIPSQIACDASVFVVSKESTINQVSLSDIRTGITDSATKFIFDNGNSSNFNTVIRKSGVTITKNHKIKALGDAEKVIDFVSKNKSHIGIIGLDILSDEDNPKVQELLSKIRILPVINDKNKLVEPSVPNLREGKYPFTKRIYLLNAEADFLVGSSFARFAGSQRGQLIVTKAGLQPYYLYERRVEMH